MQGRLLLTDCGSPQLAQSQEGASPGSCSWEVKSQKIFQYVLLPLAFMWTRDYDSTNDRYTNNVYLACILKQLTVGGDLGGSSRLYGGSSIDYSRASRERSLGRDLDVDLPVSPSSYSTSRRSDSLTRGGGIVGSSLASPPPTPSRLLQLVLSFLLMCPSEK